MALQRRVRSASRRWQADSASLPFGSLTVGLLLGCMTLASCCRAGVADPRGPVGDAQRVILDDATAIMLAVACGSSF